MSIVALCGSIRAESFTRRALDVAAQAARKLGVEVVETDLRALPYFEEGVSTLSPAALALKDLVRKADGLIIATPVYHDSYSGVLKNGLDHLYDELADKVCALIAVGGGGTSLGQALEHLRAVMRETNTWVLPRQVQVPRSREAFGADGQLTSPELKSRLERLGQETVLRVRQLRPKKG